MSEMIYGIHAVQALLERAPERFQEVFILKGRDDKRLMPLIHALEAQGVVIQLANRQFLDEKSEGAVHQGIIARVKPGRQYRKRSAGSDRFARQPVPADPRWCHRPA
ncbi:RNA methyltransferase substrate-binding domain-containing protein [Escherichia coli]